MYIVSGKWILSQDTVDGQIQINISNTGTNADCTSYVRSAGLHCDSLMGEIPTTLKSHVLFFSYFFPTLLHFFNARVIIFSSSSFRDSTKWTHCDLLFAPASTSSHIQSCNHFRWYLTIFSSSPLLLSLKPLQPRSRFPTRSVSMCRGGQRSVRIASRPGVASRGVRVLQEFCLMEGNPRREPFHPKMKFL